MSGNMAEAGGVISGAPGHVKTVTQLIDLEIRKELSLSLQGIYHRVVSRLRTCTGCGQPFLIEQKAWNTKRCTSCRKR